ncbi:S8 family serine peptidase [Antarctobacter jejuensis]|uniref:S8 family serine peptidase n=1 Tax=Antarctobacter jejuensis TaxID=1439938 RepID=UPI003FD11866
MVHHWTEPRPHTFHETYLDWSRLIGHRRDMLPPEAPERGPEYAPVFVRLIPGDSIIAARQALLSLVQDRASPLLMDAAEAAALAERITVPCDLDGLPDEYMLYRRIGTPDSDHAHLFEVLDTGTPVQMPCADPEPQPRPQVPASPCPGAPIVAAIDDGIGFLNGRFCRQTDKGLKTRFHALWLQSLHQYSAMPSGAASGRVLDAAEIDGMITTGDERACYADLNAELFPGDVRRETGFSTTHGTHVLDLAAGADPEDGTDPARDWPLLAVQLPPESIDDTSGTMFESYLIMGMRWILRMARQVDRTAQVIVNVSLGVLAGPKDGTRFAEYQMAREARLWEEVTGQAVQIVWAFGNDFRSSQVARMNLTAGTEPQITWRALPDDETASYIEIHCRGGDTGSMQVGLTAPGGEASGLTTMAPGDIRSLERGDGAALARIYHVPERRLDAETVCAAHYVLALAPTRGQKMTEPETPSGAWTVTVSSTVDCTVLVQVQRDDAIRGSGIKGRQSYLDHSDAYDWDAGRAAYVKPADDGPICDDGTHSAFVTATAAQVRSTGAARLSGRVAPPDLSNYRPASYSAQGADWSVPGPTASTLTAFGDFYAGVRAAGTLTGSTRRLAGTSAAAGRHSRAMALAAAGNPVPQIAADDPRLGKAILLIPETPPPC